MIVGARRFQPRTSVRSGATSVRACVRIAASSTAARLGRQPDRVVVLADDDQLVAGGDDGVHRRVERRLRAGRAQPDQRRIVEGEERLAEGLPDQLRDAREVDLVAAEVEQLDVDDRQPGLAAGLGRRSARSGRRRARAGPRSPPTRRATSTFAASRISATMWYGSGRRRGSLVIASSVLMTSVSGSSISGDEDDDRRATSASWRCRGRRAPSGCRCGRRSRSGRCSARASGSRPPSRPCRDRRGRRCAALVGVGEHELGDDREDLRRPAEDHRVVGLEDPRATLAQLVELALEAGVDDADQRADDEDAAQGHRQHRDARTRRAHRRRPSCPGRACAAGCATARSRQGPVVPTEHADDERPGSTPIAATTNRPRISAIVPRAMKLSKA